MSLLLLFGGEAPAAPSHLPQATYYSVGNQRAAYFERATFSWVARFYEFEEPPPAPDDPPLRGIIVGQQQQSTEQRPSVVFRQQLTSAPAAPTHLPGGQAYSVGSQRSAFGRGSATVFGYPDFVPPPPPEDPPLRGAIIARQQDSTEQRPSAIYRQQLWTPPAPVLARQVAPFYSVGSQRSRFGHGYALTFKAFEIESVAPPPSSNYLPGGAWYSVGTQRTAFTYRAAQVFQFPELPSVDDLMPPTGNPGDVEVPFPWRNYSRLFTPATRFLEPPPPSPDPRDTPVGMLMVGMQQQSTEIIPSQIWNNNFLVWPYDIQISGPGTSILVRRRRR